MNAPRLRFKEFIEKWQVKKLGEITDKIGDGLHSTPVYDENGDYYFINGNNLTNYKVSLFENTKRVNEAEFNKHKVDLNNQTILMSINGTIGNMAFYNGEKVILGKSACYLNLKLNENKDFLFNVLQTSKLKAYFEKELTGSTIKNLSLTTIKNTKIYLPAVPEQTKIANFLTAVDEKIAQLTQKADLLVRYKKSVMQQIFSQQLRFKDDDGREFPDWEATTLENCASFYRGASLSKADIDVNGKYNCVHYGELFTTYNEVIKSVKSKTNITNNFKSEFGDILMPSSDVTPAGLAKACCILKAGVVLGGDINIIRVKNTIAPIFISYLLNFEKNKIIQLVSGTTVKHIYIKDIKSIELSIPTAIAEQNKIADFLTALDDKISQNHTQLNALKHYKQGLLQQMFV